MLKVAIKQLLSMAVPMMSTRLTQILTTFISMIVLAQLGHTVLAASFTIASYRIFVLLIFFSALFALGAIVGRQFGAKKTEDLRPLLQQSWLLAVLLSVPIIVLYIFVHPIMVAIKQPAAVIPYITQYFHVFLYGIPMNMISGVNNQFLSGLKKQKYVTYTSILVLLLSTFLNIALVFGKFGFPKMGVEGSALAFIIVNVVSMLFSGFYLIKFLPCNLLTLELKEFLWIKKIIQVGAPIAFQTTSEMVGLMVITIITGWFGKVAMGASQISSEYMLLVLVPIFGLSEANSIVVSHSVGEKKMELTQKFATAGVILCTLITLFVGLLFLIFHRPFVDLFLHFKDINASQIYHLSLILLAIRILRMLFDGIAMVYTGSLRGLFDTRFPMWLSILNQWILIIPLILLLSITLNMGVIGIAIASTISRVITSVVLHFRWSSHFSLADTS